MCGILATSGAEWTRTQFKDALQCMAHRGPDDSGLFKDESVFLGHKRLSIVDLSSRGHQPMWDQEGRCAIIFNGEIYNFRELKNTVAHNHLQSRTDTEVLLYGLKEKQEHLLNQLNGEWAFVFYDRATKEFLVSRDRFGIKPLFYYWDGSMLIFASEIKSILKLIPKSALNYQAVFDFLNYGYQDESGETFIQDIHRVPPGTFAKVSVAQPRFEFIKFYDLPSDEYAIQNGEIPHEKFYTLFSDAVRIRQPDEVKYGISLSSGIDSSGILFAARHDHPETFTMDYALDGFSERTAAQSLARKLHVPNTPVPLPDNVNFISMVKDILFYLEEPSSHYSVFSQWMLFQKAKERGCKVLLSGQGADELLGGYTSFYPYKILDILSECMRGRSSPKAVMSELYALGRFFGTAHFLTALRLYFPALRSHRTVYEHLVQRPYQKYQRVLRFPRHSYSNENLRNVLANSFLGNSLLTLLRDEDKISMRFSIETRVPFLDHRLVDFSFRLPHRYKIYHGWTKYLLRKALAGKLSDEIVWKRRKLGYPTPIEHLLRANRESVMRVMLADGSLLIDFFGKSNLESHVDDCFQDPVSGMRRVWRLLQLELWQKQFVSTKT